MKSSYHGVVNFLITGSRRNGLKFGCYKELQSNQCDEKGANLLQPTLFLQSSFFLQTLFRADFRLSYMFRRTCTIIATQLNPTFNGSVQIDLI